MKIRYEDWKPSAKSLALVQIANAICAEMQAEGYDLTLRQLYYQFVARGYIENTERSYKNLGSVINKARLAGLLDWSYIEDRTRNLVGLPHSTSPATLIAAQENRYFTDLWLGQVYRPEVWVEKEALVSVVQRPAVRWDVNFFACRGYVSQSELHAAALRHKRYEALGQTVIVIHLGDHDPSGIDMTRDVQERLTGFGTWTNVERIALNMDQVDQYNPPPNPAKLTDSRSNGYVSEYGESSWELDALTPSVIDALVDDRIQSLISNPVEMADRREIQRVGRAQLRDLSENWTAVTEWLERNDA